MAGVVTSALLARVPVPVRDDSARQTELAARHIEETAWIESVLDGHTDAYRKLVDRYQRPVYTTILRFVRSAADAEDLAQQAFLNAFRALGRYDTSRRFSTWLLGIAVNGAKDWLKSKKRGEGEMSVDPAGDEGMFAAELPDPEQSAIVQDHLVRLRSLVVELPLEYREVILLKDIEGLSYSEVQEILDLPLTTLKMRAVRGRATLKQRMSEAEHVE